MASIHWVTAVQIARDQYDVTYEEWCALYYDHTDPTWDQFGKCTETAREVLVRNNVIDESVTEFDGLSDGWILR